MMRTALNSMAMSIYYLVLTENGACRKGGGSTAEEGIDVSKINVRLDKQRIEEASELFQLHHPPLLDAADVELTKESTYASKYTRATEKAALILFSLRESLSEGDFVASAPRVGVSCMGPKDLICQHLVCGLTEKPYWWHCRIPT